MAALEGGSLLASEDSQKAEEALSGAFLQADKRLISRFVLQFLNRVLIKDVVLLTDFPYDIFQARTSAFRR